MSKKRRQFMLLQKSALPNPGSARSFCTSPDGKLNFNFIFCPPKRKLGAYAPQTEERFAEPILIPYGRRCGRPSAAAPGRPYPRRGVAE